MGWDHVKVLEDRIDRLEEKVSTIKQDVTNVSDKISILTESRIPSLENPQTYIGGVIPRGIPLKSVSRSQAGDRKGTQLHEANVVNVIGSGILILARANLTGGSFNTGQAQINLRIDGRSIQIGGVKGTYEPYAGFTSSIALNLDKLADDVPIFENLSSVGLEVNYSYNQPMIFRESLQADFHCYGRYDNSTSRGNGNCVVQWIELAVD